MGDIPSSSAALKAARKQPNPRACAPSSSASANCDSSDNRVAEAKRRDQKKTGRQTDGGDPSACGGTVVTVIDTSTSGWKSEKRFRRGKGERKKVWNVGRKRRKLGEKLVVEKEKVERLRPLADLREREQELQNEVRDALFIGQLIDLLHFEFR